MDQGGREHHIAQLGQVVFVGAVIAYVALKIRRKLQELQHILSDATIKARQQFLWALLLQSSVPMLFIVLPMLVTLISLIFELKQMRCKSIDKLPIN